MSESINDSIQVLKLVGAKRSEAFSSIGINTIKDLLYFFPRTYLDRTNIIQIDQIYKFIRNGYEGEVTILAKAISNEVLRFKKKSILKVVFQDSSGELDCVWFNGVSYFAKVFKEQEYFALSGKPVVTKFGHIQLSHPDFDRLDLEESQEFFNTGKIIPVYTIPKELKKTNISDFNIRRIIQQAVNNYSSRLEESLPDYILHDNNLMGIVDTIVNLHYPAHHELLSKARHRIKYEELFYFEILVALRKNFIKNQSNGSSFTVRAAQINKLLDKLDFELTNAQNKTLKEIREDMESLRPMNRLLQGDVGSGKTIVALISMLICVDNNLQAALMVPTEILALQHYSVIRNLLSDFDIEIILLTGSKNVRERREIQTLLDSRKNAIIIGTHALFEETVKLDNLGLVVIDEQHRFGVLQRFKLIKKGKSPDVLVMSATPIPRTLSMTIYGDLDVSIIDEMPKNRIPVKTYLRGKERLPKIYKFINDKIDEGSQAFIIYPLVEQSDKIDLEDAESNFEYLKTTYFVNRRVALLHGKMSWSEKETIMEQFSNHEHDILVSTTVIEVGIDIPNAAVMLINEAHRFGIAQLHQLRGRIGRGDKESHCILVSSKEYINSQFNENINLEYLSPAQIERYKSSIRMNALIKYNSGFKLSEIDLKLRGPGNIFGTSQSGYPDLKYADIVNDSELLLTAKTSAFDIIENDIFLQKEKNFLIKKTLKSNYKNNLAYSNIA